MANNVNSTSRKPASNPLFLLTKFLHSNSRNNTVDEPGMFFILGGEFKSGTYKKPINLDDFYIDIMEVIQKAFKDVIGFNDFSLKVKVILQNN